MEGGPFRPDRVNEVNTQSRSVNEGLGWPKWGQILECGGFIEIWISSTPLIVMPGTDGLFPQVMTSLGYWPYV